MFRGSVGRREAGYAVGGEFSGGFDGAVVVDVGVAGVAGREVCVHCGWRRVRVASGFGAVDLDEVLRGC